MYGSLLFACYDEDTETFQTIAKAGTGFTQEDLKHLYEILHPFEIENPDPQVRFKDKNVDIWFTPKVVLELKVADFTMSPVYLAASSLTKEQKGISLRFP